MGGLTSKHTHSAVAVLNIIVICWLCKLQIKDHPWLGLQRVSRSFGRAWTHILFTQNKFFFGEQKCSIEPKWNSENIQFELRLYRQIQSCYKITSCVAYKLCLHNNEYHKSVYKLQEIRFFLLIIFLWNIFIPKVQVYS